MRPQLALALCLAGPASAQSVLYELYPDSCCDVFGWSCARLGDVDGDGAGDFAIGARRDEPPGYPQTFRTGSTRVYSGATGTLIAAFYGDADGDVYGHRIAGPGDLDGDGLADILIGNPSDAGGLGQAEVRSGGSGAVLHSFLGAGATDGLGIDVGAPGDVTGDGVPDLLVAERGAEPAGLPADHDTGAAVLRSGADGSVVWRAFGDGPDDSFGFSVAGVGDVDLDGFPDVAAGAPECNGVSGACTDPGYVRVLSGPSGTPLFTVVGTSPGGELGFSVAPAGDANADGVPDVAAGAWHDATAGVQAGAAFVYSGVDGAALLTLVGDGPYDQLGACVDGLGDLDGDGTSDLLVGAPEICGASVTSPECPGPGYVRIVSGADGATLFSDVGRVDEGHFGLALCALDAGGDAVPDNVPDFVVGARYSDETGPFGGSAYVYSGRTLALTADGHELSVAAGGSTAFALVPGPAFAGDLHLLLGSLAGVAPGLPVGPGLVLPLNPDPYLLHTLAHPGAAPLAGAFGALDAAGAAGASFALPAGSPPSLVGLVAHHAFCVLGPFPGSVTFASNALPLSLLP